MKKLLKFDTVVKNYGKKTALNGVSFDLTAGEIVGLLGPNGSGKTTILKLALTILRPDHGEVLVSDKVASYETRKHISYMPDREFLYDNMKISETIDYYNDMFSDFDLKRSDELCKSLKLNKEDYYDSLSKGNKEKVVLMLTLSRKTSVYLLDEPLGSLDPVIKADMLDVIESSKRDDAVILIATHLIRDTETLFDRVIFINEGKVAYDGLKKEFKKGLEEKYLEVFRNA